jgi:mannose-6-phosphate isomerase-like protein (cupin superfamily)
MPTAISLTEKLSAFSDHWSPKIIAQFNGHDVMVVKVKGEFVWHSHAETDDFFLVLEGSLTIQLRDGEVRLGPGDLYVVSKGVEHRLAGGQPTPAHRTSYKHRRLARSGKARDLVNRGSCASRSSAPATKC